MDPSETPSPHDNTNFQNAPNWDAVHLVEAAVAVVGSSRQSSVPRMERIRSESDTTDQAIRFDFPVINWPISLCSRRQSFHRRIRKPVLVSSFLQCLWRLDARDTNWWLYPLPFCRVYEMVNAWSDWRYYRLVVIEAAHPTLHLGWSDDAALSQCRRRPQRCHHSRWLALIYRSTSERLHRQNQQNKRVRSSSSKLRRRFNKGTKKAKTRKKTNACKL